MAKSKKTPTGDGGKDNTTTKTKATSDGGKDTNDGGRPASEIKNGKGETSGSRGTHK